MSKTVTITQTSPSGDSSHTSSIMVRPGEPARVLGVIPHGASIQIADVVSFRALQDWMVSEWRRLQVELVREGSQS